MSIAKRIGARRWLAAVLAAVMVPLGLGAASSRPASAATPPTLDLRVLLIGGVGGSASDVTTAAWGKALAGEGVPYTEVDATGVLGSEAVGLPALSSGTTGFFNGVVIADSPVNFAAGQLSALFSYESSFGVRQLDGYMYPNPALGVTDVSGGALDGTIGALTPAGLTALPELKGPVPFDSGTYGYTATATVGAPFTPWLDDTGGHVMAGVYQHPSTDAQAGVSELSLFFNYNANQLQWLLLAPGLINWVTNDAHLGLYRNYFGQDIDDNFIADNEWSSQFQCTPAATNPPDYTCPAADQGVAPGSAAGVPADVQMSAADVAYVVAWEKQNGITLNLAFNGIGACTADKAADQSSANCSGAVSNNGTTFTDPGHVVNASYPNDAGLVNALLANQSAFNWINHTWSHLFLGCTNWSPQVLTTVTANSSGGTFTAGAYSYEITAATAYGESEPSAPQSATVGAGGSVALTWPEATNGTGTDGTLGASLAQEQASHTGGTGFWGYNVYREDPGSTTYGLVGRVPENSNAGPSTTYSFTDTGTTAGTEPNSGPDFPTATNPGIDCSGDPGSWLPATSATPDSSIEQEIALNQAFAAANGLTNYTPSAVVTGEHSGIDNPNMAAALAGVGVTTFAEDASRQPQQYSLGAAVGAPRYPSNIYYNASNWPDQLNEYNTLYVAQGTSLGAANPPGETGHCANTSATTCATAPLTEADMLASESHIMLSHVLANDPRVGYAHQSNLVGPATLNGQDYGYTILGLINDMLAQYNSWFTAPLTQMTDVSEAQVLAMQAAWAQAEKTSSVSASETNGVVTITNSGSPVNVPVTMPTGTTTAGGAAFGQSYGGQLSDWVSLGTGATETLDLHIPPTFTSSASAISIVGAPFSFTVSTTGEPVPAITESGALPAGLTFTDNANGTATIAGTAATGSGGSYPLTLTATNPSGSVTQAFTLTNNEAPAITSAPTATFVVGVAGTYSVTTHGFPAATITETGPLPGGLSFTAGTGATAGTATIAGTPASGTTGTYPVSLSATNASGSTATLALTITVSTAAPPSITTGASAFFTMGQAGSFAVTASGAPVPTVAETGALPAGLTWVDQGNGTALLSGTPATTGTTTVSVTAANGQSPNATQTLSITVGQAAAITSAATTTFTMGAAGTFKVTTSGYPSPSLAESGALPSGVTFTDNHDGSATLAGIPAAGTAGAYPLTLTATNGNGSMTQSFALDVDQAPVITSSTSTSFTATTAGSFSVTATGLPVPSITETGPLPAGVTFKDNGNGTATLAGTPAAGTARTYPLTFTASNGAASTATQSFMLAVTPGPGQIVALNPVRLLDSRIGTGSSGPVAPGATVHLTVHTLTDGVPASGVGAVALNVTVTQPKAAGYLTVYPDGQSPRPVTSNLNFSAGQTVPNLVIAPVGADGKVAIYNGSGGTVQIVADVSGYFVAGSPALGGAFGPLNPARLLDSRIGTGSSGPVAPGATVHLTVHTLTDGVPASGVGAVALNVTVTQPKAAGYLTVYPDGQSPRPVTSNLNFSAGQTVPNLVIAPVGADGKVAIYNGSGGTVQIVADVSGYFVAGSPALGGAFGPLNPARLLDSRIGTGSSGPVAPGATVHLTVHTLTDGVPASGVGAVALNVTVTQPKAAGYLTVYPDGQSPRPVTSNLNFSAGQTVPNLVIAPVGADGKVAIYNGSGGTVQIVADISGWFSGN